jgi:hypothetical protein
MDEANGGLKGRPGVAALIAVALARPRAMLAAVVVLAALVAAPIYAASTPSRVEIAICPHIMQTTYPYAGPGVGPGNFGCLSTVFSAGMIFVRPDNTCTTPTNTDLGTFLTSDEPLGAWVAAGGLNSCATTPPTLGPGAAGGALTVSLTQTGSCPATLAIPAQIGPHAAVVFPIGSLPFGSYSVTVDYPDQTVLGPQAQQPMSWIGSHASGTLHVGTTFTETDRSALADTGKSDRFAVLLNNSVAGQGAGQLVSSKTANPSTANLTGTDYYACGTISIAATVTYGKRGANGVARLTGNGTLTGGTGNYKGITGTFTVTGTYSTKTYRGTLALKGTATY